MAIFQKEPEKITKEDIFSLLENKISEGRKIEYKRQLPAKNDAGKKEFYKDVSSFANAIGGYIFYGIDCGRDGAGKSTGVPTEVLGIEGLNPDAIKLQFEEGIRSGITPVIPGIKFLIIEGFSKGSVLGLYIPKSWFPPHMVSFQNSSKFYSRHSGGIYQMDYTEIRNSFALSESLPEKLRTIRKEKIKQISGEFRPFNLSGKSLLMVQMIPFSSLHTGSNFFHDKKAFDLLKPIEVRGGWSTKYNLDGIAKYSRTGIGEIVGGYVQFYRNGIIEAVDSYLLENLDNNQKCYIPGGRLEFLILNAIRVYLEFYKGMGIEPPIYLSISLLNVLGGSMAHSKISPILGPQYRIDRDNLILPEIILENFDSNLSSLLKPAFDALWNGVGFEKSYNYDEYGNWIPSS